LAVGENYAPQAQKPSPGEKVPPVRKLVAEVECGQETAGK